MSGCVDRAYDFGNPGSLDPNPLPDPSGGPDPSGDPDPNPDPTSDPTPPPPPPPSIPGPPLLVEAGFVDNLTLQLTFSEGIAPAQAVDPQQFRLSGVLAPPGGMYYYGTFYREIGMWNGADYYCGKYCYEYCDYYKDDYCYDRCFDYCYTPPGPPVRIAAISQVPERPDVLLLSLDNGIGGGVCAQLSNYPEDWVSDLFIHYTPQGLAPVQDNDGELLAPIAEHWALDRNAQDQYTEGFLPYMDPIVPIPCPF